MRYFLSAALVCLAGPALGAQDSARANAAATCPSMRGASTPEVFPDTVYVTWVVNGKVMLRHQRQEVRGRHSVIALDSMPSSLDPSLIEAIDFPVGEAARRWEVCPAVRVVTIRMRPNSAARIPRSPGRFPTTGVAICSYRYARGGGDITRLCEAWRNMA